MNLTVTKGYKKKNGTNIGRGIGSIECWLLGEDSKRVATIPNGSCGHFHTCC
jgi:hypothetical protein